MPRRAVLRVAMAAGATAAAAGSLVGGSGRAEASTQEAATAGHTTDTSYPVGTTPLLGGPYLLDPDRNGVRVVWHTEDQGSHQVVLVGSAVADLTAEQAVAAATGLGTRELYEAALAARRA